MKILFFASFLALATQASSLAGYSAIPSRALNPVNEGQLYKILSGPHASVALAVEKAVRQSYHRGGFGVENKAGEGKMILTSKAFEIVDEYITKEQKSALGRWVRAHGVREVLNFGLYLSQNGGSAGQALLAFLPSDESADVLVIETEYESD